MTAKKRGIGPADLLDEVRECLDGSPGKEFSLKQLWEYIVSNHPDLARQVQMKVQTYKDPARNNEVWFIGFTVYYLGKLDGYEVQTGEGLEMNGEHVWQLVKAIP